MPEAAPHIINNADETVCVTSCRRYPVLTVKTKTNNLRRHPWTVTGIVMAMAMATTMAMTMTSQQITIANTHPPPRKGTMQHQED
jgi:hypothetical protein